MFDIGFSELAIIGLVALIVIGPEELPRVARTVGHLLGRLRRYVSDVKSDISREMELAELHRMKDEVQDAARSFEQSINDQARAFDQEMREAVAPIGDALADTRASLHGLAHDPASATPELAAAAPDAEVSVAALPESTSVATDSEQDARDENQLDLFGGSPAVAAVPAEPVSRS